MGFIADKSCRFHVFVANLVQLIQDLSTVDQWRHVDTKLNPADDTSRGLSPRAFMASKWSQGPVFLWRNKGELPLDQKECLPDPSQVLPCDPEIKVGTVLATSAASKVGSV